LWRRDHEFGVQFLDATMRREPQARHQESRRREPAS
jgi:hypothetical protein